MAIKQVVVIGGDAAGMAAASQALRVAGPDSVRIVAYERSHHTSYSACGIPYWVAGDVDRSDSLVARSAAKHRERGIDLRMRTEVEEIDLDRRRVQARDLDSGTTAAEDFDELVVATGAVPIRPSLPGVDAPGVHGVQTLDDGAALLGSLGSGPRRAVVVGGGYIGIEMAEAMMRRGLQVTVVDRSPEPMRTLDPDVGALVRTAMEGMGIQLRTGTAVHGFETGRDGGVTGVVTPDETIPADIVVLGLGVRPNTTVASAAGIPVGPNGGIRTDIRQRAAEGVWAGGDCVEVRHRISGCLTHVALGTHANKHGRVIGTNLGGGYATFPGVVGTAVSKVCDLEVGRTGLLEAEATEAGFQFVTATVDSTTRAGYFPGAAPLTVKMLAERGSGRLLGAQIVGREDSAKRVDICATALWNGMTVQDMVGLDLGYAPPFSPVWDPVLIGARKAADAVLADQRG